MRMQTNWIHKQVMVTLNQRKEHISKWLQMSRSRQLTTQSSKHKKKQGTVPLSTRIQVKTINLRMMKIRTFYRKDRKWMRLCSLHRNLTKVTQTICNHMIWCSNKWSKIWTKMQKSQSAVLLKKSRMPLFRKAMRQ